MFLQLYFYINVHIFPIICGDIEASAIRRIGRQGEIKIEHQMHITNIILPRSRKNLVTDRLAQQIHLSSCRTEIEFKILRQTSLVAEGQKLPDQLDIGDKYAFLLKIKRTAHIAVLSGTAPNQELFKAPRLILGT